METKDAPKDTINNLRLPGESSEITETLAKLVGKHVQSNIADSIIRDLFLWADKERARGIARNRTLALGNLIRSSAGRVTFAPPRGEYNLAGFLPAEPAAHRNAQTAQSAPAPAAQQIVKVGSLDGLISHKDGFVPVPCPEIQSLDVAKQTFLEQYVAQWGHPFVRYALINGNEHTVFVGSCRGPLDKGPLKGSRINVAFRINGRSPNEVGGSSLSCDTMSGMTFWVWAIRFNENDSLRFWLNAAQQNQTQGRDVQDARARIILKRDGFVFSQGT